MKIKMKKTCIALLSAVIAVGSGSCAFAEEDELANLFGDVHEIMRDEFMEGTGLDIAEGINTSYFLASHEGDVHEYSMFFEKDAEYLTIKVLTNIATLEQGVSISTDNASESVELIDCEYLDCPAVYVRGEEYEDSSLLLFKEAESRMYSVSVASEEKPFADEESLGKVLTDILVRE